MKGRGNWKYRVFVVYASVALSSGVNLVANKLLILQDILIQKTQCPMCIFTRSMGFQTLTATILPTAISAFGSNLKSFRPAGVNLYQGNRDKVAGSWLGHLA